MNSAVMEVVLCGGGLVLLAMMYLCSKPLYWVMLSHTWRHLVSDRKIEQTLGTLEEELSRLGLPHESSVSDSSACESLVTAWQRLVSSICGGRPYHQVMDVLPVVAGLASSGSLQADCLPLVEKLALLNLANERLQPVQVVRFKYALHGTSRLIAAARYD